MHKKIELKSQKKIIPVREFDIKQQFKNKNNKQMTIKKFINITTSQKKIVNARNKNLQVVYKMSSNLSQPLNLKSVKYVDQLTLSPPKNPNNTVVINRRERFLLNLKKAQLPQKQKRQTNYQKFPQRTTKLKNNNPYKYYMFQNSQKKTQNSIDRFYSQQMRARTARTTGTIRQNLISSKMQLPSSTVYVKQSVRRNNNQSKKNVRTITTHQKYLSPWDLQREENRQQYLLNQ